MVEIKPLHQMIWMAKGNSRRVEREREQRTERNEKKK